MSKFNAGDAVEFDFESDTYRGEYVKRATERRGVPTYFVKVDGRVERFSVKSQAGRTLRKAS